MINNLSSRIIIAIIFLPLIAFVLLSGEITFILFLSLVVAIASSESVEMLLNQNTIDNDTSEQSSSKIQSIIRSAIVPIMSGLITFILLSNKFSTTLTAFYIFTIVVIIWLAILSIRSAKSEKINSLITLALIGIYNAFALATYQLYFPNEITIQANLLLNSQDTSNTLSYFIEFIETKPIVSILLIVWASDTGAYFFGKTLGGPKLAPVISANKTISGSCGGMLCAVITSCVLLPSSFAFSIFYSLLLGILFGILAQVGDLLESMLKRYCKVKDSSKLLAAHGGILDRLDSIILPVIAASIITN